MNILMLDTRNVVSNETNEGCTYVHVKNLYLDTLLYMDDLKIEH